MAEHMSEQSSIVYSVRLPKDPPKNFDLTRLPLRTLYDATQSKDMDSSLQPICKLVGLPDYSLLKKHDCSSQSDWAAAYPRERCFWIVLWLVREDIARSPKK